MKSSNVGNCNTAVLNNTVQVIGAMNATSREGCSKNKTHLGTEDHIYIQSHRNGSLCMDAIILVIN